MSTKLNVPDLTELKPKINVIGVGGAGGNAINNMMASGLTGVQFVVANTDAQALSMSSAEHRIQMGVNLTEGLGAGSRPEIGAAAAEEAYDEISAQVAGSHMVFVAAGMGGGTGTGAAPVVARAAREKGILTVGVVTKPFQFEGQRRMVAAEAGILELKKHVDTLIVIPNQNLFRIANEKTTFADAFKLADGVLHSGVSCITDLIIREGLINLDFADVKVVMNGMGTAMMGTGQASGDRRAIKAAEEAIANPLLDNISLARARGVLMSITGGQNLTLYEVDEAASRIKEEIDDETNIIVGATFDQELENEIRVSIVAAGIEVSEPAQGQQQPARVNAQETVGLKAKLENISQNTDSDKAAGDKQDTLAGNREDESAYWQSSENIRVEKRPPHLKSAELPPPIPDSYESDEFMNSDLEGSDPATQSRAMPAIDEFPVVAQKELRARLRESTQPHPENTVKKVGLFQRIAGMRRANQKSDSFENKINTSNDGVSADPTRKKVGS